MGRIGPIIDKEIKDHTGYGLISVFTGDGRGKTTAGLGTAIRAVGALKRVAIVYFDKGGDSHYSERRILDLLAGAEASACKAGSRDSTYGTVEYYVTGRDRIDAGTGRFDFSVTDLDRSEAARGLELVCEILEKNEHDLLVLDEINSTTALGMLDETDVLKVLKTKPDKLEIILTGRNAPGAFREFAHLVTEMKLKKHYFYSGVQAREGIDY